MGRSRARGEHQSGLTHQKGIDMATVKKAAAAKSVIKRAAKKAVKQAVKKAVKNTVTRIAPSQGFLDGVAMRSKVLGPDYVAGAFKNSDDINRPFQEIATEMAWGKVWTRPGLTLRERSLLTLAICIALNRPNEVRIHLRGAIRNGVTRVELRELILHSFLYCGGPAALDAYKTVREAWPEIERAEKRLAEKTGKKPVKKAVKKSAKK